MCELRERLHVRIRELEGHEIKLGREALGAQSCYCIDSCELGRSKSQPKICSEGGEEREESPVNRYEHFDKAWLCEVE